MSGERTSKVAATVDRQITTLHSHAVRFELCSEAEAAAHLTDNTYFFKLKAFDKLFARDDEGNYYDLDFGQLKDVATIDYHLRRLVLRLTGDADYGELTLQPRVYRQRSDRHRHRSVSQKDLI